MNPPRSATNERSIPPANAAAIPAAISDDPRDSPRWLAVYVVVQHPGRAPYWLSVGKAFVNSDGSLNVRLDANPIDGKLHIRRPPSREPTHAAGQAETESATESATSSRPRTDAARVQRSQKTARR
jgi:hypothetical protein